MKVEISDLSGGGGGTENVGSESAKKMPKDAHVMSAILRDMGIAEWEPRVINQLMEFSYSYVTNIIGEKWEPFPFLDQLIISWLSIFHYRGYEIQEST